MKVLSQGYSHDDIWVGYPNCMGFIDQTVLSNCTVLYIDNLLCFCFNH